MSSNILIGAMLTDQIANSTTHTKLIFCEGKIDYWMVLD